MSAVEKLTAEERATLEAAARPLWQAMEAHGWVDGHGGSEFERIFPETLDFIHREANPLAYEEVS